jgi:hypothetical protein
VKCPSCRTECVLEGLVRNAEIAAKENIGGGINIEATPGALHRRLVSVLSESPGMPLDLLEKVVVVGEEHHCVPAFCFYCHGTMSFSCEVGHEEYQLHDTYKRDPSGGVRVTTKKHTYIVYSPSSGTVNDSLTIFASGSAKLAPQVKKLYSRLDPKRLVDVEDLEFPADVETHDFNLPMMRAFNECAAPIVEEALRKKVEKGFASHMYIRNSRIDGSRIEKDEPQRVFLGLYRFACTYGGRECIVWVTGDGRDAYAEGAPIDRWRLDDFNRRTAALAKASVPPQKKVGCLIYAVAAVCGSFAWYGISHYYNYGPGDTLLIILFALLAIGLVGLRIYALQKRKARKAGAEVDLRAFEDQKRRAAGPYLGATKTLRGVFGGGEGEEGTGAGGQAAEEPAAAARQAAPPAGGGDRGTGGAAWQAPPTKPAAPAVREPARPALSLDELMNIGKAKDK